MKKIKTIIAISMVKNEMDIIESFVRHTLTFADKMIISDHMSSDRTREILDALVAEGLPVILHDIHQAMQVQFEKTNEMLAEALEQGADLVLPLDADEFILPAKDGHTVRSELEALDAEQVYDMRARRFAPREPHKDEDKFLLSRPLYQGTGWDMYISQKVLVGAEAARRYELSITFGNHACFEHGDPNQLHGTLPLDTVVLAHVYWRSHEQIAAKQLLKIVNIKARMSACNLCIGDDRKIIRQLEQKSPIEFTTEGMESYEPARLPSLPCPQLRYSHDVRPDPLVSLLHTSLALAEDHSELLALRKELPATIVVPYLGEEAPWRLSLTSAQQEVYPYKEIIVPILSGDLPAAEKEKLAAESILVLEAPAAEKREQALLKKLAATAKGAYVAWLLPGETSHPKRVQAMLTSMVLQEFSYPIYLSNVQRAEAYEFYMPYFNPPKNEDKLFSDTTRAHLWQMMLSLGCYPSRGLAGVLCRRDLMDACGWLADCFLDGEPLRMSMWKRLLTTEIPNASQFDDTIIILGVDYTGALPKATMEEYVRHQIELRVLLEKDDAFLSREQKHRKLLSWKARGHMIRDEVAKKHCNTSTLPWQIYDGLLAQS